MRAWATLTVAATPRIEHGLMVDRKSTRLNPSHSQIPYAVFCLKNNKQQHLHLDRELAGERHPLALAAGELGRVAVAEGVDLDQVEQLSNPPPHVALLPLADLEP